MYRWRSDLAVNKKNFVLVLILAATYVVVGCSKAPAPVAAGPALPPKAAQVTEHKDMREDRIIEMISHAVLTPDGQHVAMLSRDVEYVYVLRLDSGDLYRLRRHFLSLKGNPRIDLMVSTDGSAVLYGDGTVQSLTGPREKQLSSFNENLRSESLGFFDARRVLAYQGKTSALELIDTEKDEVLWSVPAGAALAGWESRPQRWSPSRRFIAWADGINVSLLSAETGQMRSFSPPPGMRVSTLLFSKDERSLLVQGTAASSGVGVSGHSNAALFDIFTSQRTELAIPGSALHFDASDGALIAFDADSRTIAFRPQILAAAAGWTAQFPGGVQVESISPEGVLFATQYEPGASVGKLMYAMNANQPSNGKIALRSVDAGPGRSPRWLTLDANRHAVFTEGTRVHVYDLQQLAIGQLSLRTIDLLTDQKALSEPAGSDPPVETLAAQWTPIGGASSVSSTAVADAAQPADPNRIVKCQDSAGAVSYVRGSCPESSTMIGAPEIQKKKLTDLEKLVKRLDQNAAEARERGEAQSSRYVSTDVYGNSRWIDSTVRQCGRQTVVIYESEALIDGKPTRLYSGSVINDRMYFSYSGAVYANCNAGSFQRRR